MSLKHICRCGDELFGDEIATSLEIHDMTGAEVVYLCDPCKREHDKFLRNETAFAVLPAEVFIFAEDTDDIDDLEIPLDVESDDWQRELRRPA